MFIDVQQALLFYVVAGWEDDFTGYVLDYGTFPDQQRPYFTLRDARHTLAAATKATGLEGSIYAGLEALTASLINREWHRDDGAALRIERCLIDANWGNSTDVVYQFCRQSAHPGVVMPSHGRFVGASSQPFSEYKRDRATASGTTGGFPTSKASGPCATSSSTRTTGSRSSTPGWPCRWAIAAVFRCSATSPIAIGCSPSTSRPSIACKPRAAAGPSTNGSCGPSGATTTGSIAWSGRRSRRRFKARCCSARRRHPLPSRGRVSFAELQRRKRA